MKKNGHKKHKKTQKRRGSTADDTEQRRVKMGGDFFKASLSAKLRNDESISCEILRVTNVFCFDIQSCQI